jgi:dTMP kinase
MDIKGKILAIEGLDGCGKDTQIRLLKEKFPRIVVFKYPTLRYTLLKDYLEQKIELAPKAIFLLFLADIAEDQKNLRKALSEKKTIILDRYIFSTIAYEVKGINYERGKQIVEGIRYLKPDMVILLDIDQKTSQTRKGQQKKLDRYEGDMEYLEKVRSNFLKLYEEKFLTENWHKIDASRDVKAVHASIMKLLG